MTENLKVSCREVQGRLKRFFEDLLNEEERESFLSHVEECEPCSLMVSSVGSFLNQVRGLGNVKVPPDFASAVITKVKQTPKELLLERPPAPKPRRLRRILIAGLLLAITGGAVFFTWEYTGIYQMIMDLRKEKPTVPPRPEVEPESEPAGETVITEEPKEPAPSTQTAPPPAEGKPAEKKKAIEPKIAAKPVEEAPPPVEETPQLEQPVVTEMKPLPPEVIPPGAATESLHWHFLYANELARGQLAYSLQNLGIRFHYPTPNLLLLTASPDRLDKLHEKIRTIYPDSTRLDDFQGSAAILKEGNFGRLTIYVQKYDTTPYDVYHWHLKFSLPNQYQVAEILEEMGLPIEHKYDQLLVFSASITKLKDVVDRLNKIEGMKFDFGLPNFKKKYLVSYSARVSIHFMKERTPASGTSSSSG